MGKQTDEQTNGPDKYANLWQKYGWTNRQAIGGTYGCKDRQIDGQT